MNNNICFNDGLCSQYINIAFKFEFPVYEFFFFLIMFYKNRIKTIFINLGRHLLFLNNYSYHLLESYKLQLLRIIGYYFNRRPFYRSVIIHFIIHWVFTLSSSNIITIGDADDTGGGI